MNGGIQQLKQCSIPGGVMVCHFQDEKGHQRVTAISSLVEKQRQVFFNGSIKDYIG